MRVYKHQIVLQFALMSQSPGCQSIEKLLKEMCRIAESMLTNEQNGNHPAADDGCVPGHNDNNLLASDNVEGRLAVSILHRRLMNRIPSQRNNPLLMNGHSHVRENDVRREPYNLRRKTTKEQDS